MFLKIMEYKKLKDSEKVGVATMAESVHFSTNIIDCKKVTFYKDEFEDINFTVFTTDPGKETERSTRINESDYDLHSVYVMNDDGKTIQKPI